MTDTTTGTAKTALITGGATGIGRGIALALAQHGANLALASRNQANLDEAARAITEATGRRCLGIVADVRQRADDGKDDSDHLHHDLGAATLKSLNTLDFFISSSSAALTPGPVTTHSR